MKTIGLLGGMTWESTELYYRQINEGVNKALGGYHAAQIAMVSVDFADIEVFMRSHDWAAAGVLLGAAAQQIEAAGADFMLICTNTFHIVADQIQDAVNIPVLHLADATAERVKRAGLDTVGLLGTSITMEEDFYRGRLEDKHGLKVVTPSAEDRQIVNDVIMQELCFGQIKDSSREEYLRIMADLQARGAQGVIEGCTEIVMLVDQQHTDIPLFDTTSIHAQAAVERAIGA